MCNSPRFASLPPSQIVPTLADEGCYLASESTFYRELRKANQHHHRGRAHKPRQVVTSVFTYGLPSPCLRLVHYVAIALTQDSVKDRLGQPFLDNSFSYQSISASWRTTQNNLQTPSLQAQQLVAIQNDYYLRIINLA